MKTWKKTGFGLCSDAEPCVFTIVLISKFPKPYVFAVVLARFGLAVAQWIAAGAAYFSWRACKKRGFGNMDKKNIVKTQGSAPGNCRNLVFYSILLSVSKTPMEFSRFICFLGAVLGLSRPQNRRFHIKTLIAGSHLQKPDQIELPGMFGENVPGGESVPGGDSCQLSIDNCQLSIV